jgi:hypothetical protein
MSNLLIDKSTPGKVTVSGLPVKLTIYGAFDHSQESIESVQTDLLVLTRLQYMHPGPSSVRFDSLLNATVSAAIAEHNFYGRLGDSLLVSTGDPYIKQVLVVGLGKPSGFGRPTLCGLFRLVFEKAMQSGSRKVSIPIFPGRLTDINLKGTAAVLKCKLNLLADQKHLEEVEILCAPQAIRHLLSGLGKEEQLCRVCHNPSIACS